MSVIVVTGASRGLGAAIKKHLEALNYDVIGFARTANPDQGILECDVSDAQSVKAAVRKIKKSGKQVFGCVNAAGIASMNLAVMMPAEVVKKVINTNLIGTIFVNQAIAPLMIRNKSGRIINFSTIAVQLGLKGEAVYAASKAGVETFSRSFAREVADFGVTVNCIAPGPIKTDLLRGVSDNQIEDIINQQIFTKIHVPQDVADITEMLLSNAAAKVTGETISVGGA